MKKVLIIGSNAFSGSDFIDLLLEKQEYEVMGISRSVEKSSLFLPYLARHSPHFHFEQIDLIKDNGKLNDILETFRPEYIVNFAAQSEVGPSWEHPDHWFQTNVVALTNLAHLLKDKKFLKKYVHISSPEVYGSCFGFIKENAPINPSTPYAASKAGGDLSLFTFYKNFDFPLVIIRSTNVYGAHQQLFKIIPRTIIYIKNKKIIPLHGKGVAIKSYIHVRDVSSGELLVMEKGKIGEIYHISPDKGIAVKNVIRLICDKMGVIFENVTEMKTERLGQDQVYTIDSSKIRTELGWVPTISFEEGLDQTIGWVDSYFEAIKKCPLQYVHKR